MRRFAWFCLRAALLAGCGVITQAAIIVIGEPIARAAQRLENPASRCATDLVRKPDGTWWRCGKLESTAGGLAEAAAVAEGTGLDHR